MGDVVLRVQAVGEAVRGAILAGIAAFFAGLIVGGLLRTNGASTRKAFQDSLRSDRLEASQRDSVDAFQKRLDSLSLRRADTIYVRAQRASQASGTALQ